MTRVLICLCTAAYSVDIFRHIFLSGEFGWATISLKVSVIAALVTALNLESRNVSLKKKHDLQMMLLKEFSNKDADLLEDFLRSLRDDVKENSYKCTYLMATGVRGSELDNAEGLFAQAEERYKHYLEIASEIKRV